MGGSFFFIILKQLFTWLLKSKIKSSDSKAWLSQLHWGCKCTQVLGSSRSQTFGRKVSEALAKRWSEKWGASLLMIVSTFIASFTSDCPGLKTLSLLTWYRKLQVQFRMCCQYLPVHQPAVALLGEREAGGRGGVGEDGERTALLPFVFIYFLNGFLSLFPLRCFLPYSMVACPTQGQDTKPSFVTVSSWGELRS